MIQSFPKARSMKSCWSRDSHCNDTSNQQGVAMILALLFLLVSTIIGVSALQVNYLNEKMTFYSMQRSKALEAAEIALLEGEDFVENYYSAIISQTLSGNDPTTNAKICEAQVRGEGGICVSKEKSDNPQEYYDVWIGITGDANSLNVWTNNSRHRSVSEDVRQKLEIQTAPKYIVEFLGYIVDAEGVSACDGSDSSTLIWPYCPFDNKQFRITALATVGNYDETRVMLQSTYVVDE